MAKSKKQDKKLLKVHHSYEPEALARKFKAPVGKVRELAGIHNNSIERIEAALRDLNYRDGSENPPAAPPISLPRS